MIEITIKTGDEAIVKKLLQFIQQLGLDVNRSGSQESAQQITITSTTPTISWAEEPERARELFGIWKDDPRDIDQLRNKAWSL